MLHPILIWFITGFGNQPAGWIPSMRPSMGRVSRATRTGKPGACERQTDERPALRPNEGQGVLRRAVPRPF